MTFSVPSKLETVLQEMHFSLGKCVSLEENPFLWGFRIMNGCLFLDDILAPPIYESGSEKGVFWERGLLGKGVFQKSSFSRGFRI